QAMLRLTNRQIAGASFGVIGYGYVGRGVANYAKALGAHTYVTEIDPVRALEAHTDGHIVGAPKDVLPSCSFVVTTTGGMRAIGETDFPFLQDNVVLGNAGHHDLEIDVEALGQNAEDVSSPRLGVTT